MIYRLLTSLGVAAGVAGVYLGAVYLISRSDTDLDGVEWVIGVPVGLGAVLVLALLVALLVGAVSIWWDWVRGR